MGIVQSGGLRDEVFFQSDICLRLERAGVVLEHSGHIPSLGKEFLSVVLCGLREREIFPVDCNGRLALVAVDRQSLGVDDVVAGKQLTIAQATDHLVIDRENRLAVVWMEHLETHRTELPVPVNPGIAIAPEGAANHKVVQEAEAIELAVRLGEDASAGMPGALLLLGGSLAVEVDRERPYGLRQYPHASSYSGDGKGAFLGDELALDIVRYGVGENHLIDSVFELAGGDALLSFQKRGKR